MKSILTTCALFLIAIIVFQTPLMAQQARLLPPINSVALQPGKDDPKQKDKGKEKDKDKDKKPNEKKVEPPPSTVFSDTLMPRAEGPRGYHPQMLGDLGFKLIRQQITIFKTVTVTTVTPQISQPPIITTTSTTTSRTTNVVIPYPIHGSFKVAENASPRPQDRVFGSYNYYDRAGLSQGVGTLPVTIATTNTVQLRSGEITTASTETIPAAPRFVHLHRETFGFEKTFLDGRASVEVRVPVLQQPSDFDSFEYHHVGDLTIVGKYAFILDPVSGDVLSGGLAITAPTGPGVDTIRGSIHSTLLQPWFGYIWNADRFFVHGFHSIVVPTDSRDVTLLFNDVGINYWLYRSDDPTRFLRFIVPTAEVHVTTPLDQRGHTAAIFVPDTVVLTGGLHVGMGRSTFTFGVGTPVTGPRPFSVEAVAQYNFRW
jgi:hypothetical protein